MICMKPWYIPLLVCLPVLAQPNSPKAPAPPDLPPDTVVASFGNGQKLTIEELKKFVSVLPPQMQQMALRDRKNFVQQYALMHRLAELATQAKLDQQSPTKEQLEFNRIYVLMNAELNDALSNIIVPAADQQRFYDSNKDRFAQVKVKVLYVSFASKPPASGDSKKYLSEAEAKAKIEKLRGEIAAGADFVKLVKAHSEDTTSAAKDGDFGTIRRTDKIPDTIRDAIFALKPGQVSEPVRQPNGYYLFRAEEITVRPYNEVREEIQNDLRQARFKEWMDQTTRSLNVKIENDAYFK